MGGQSGSSSQFRPINILFIYPEEEKCWKTTGLVKSLKTLFQTNNSENFSPDLSSAQNPEPDLEPVVTECCGVPRNVLENIFVPGFLRRIFIKYSCSPYENIPNVSKRFFSKICRLICKISFLLLPGNVP